jgi:outer membrane cobalamin receptor
MSWGQSNRAENAEPVRTSITVVERVATEAPASVAVLEKKQLEQIPGVNVDDRLRMVPGFSLFRRSSSLVAQPTTQGISLRGIGSTGASRTLVLWDGIPINDPFGGWVYWTRVAPEELSRVEVSRGASTSVFGDRALGGAIALFTREAERGRVTGSWETGNRNTNAVSAGGSWLTPRWAVSGAGRAFTTNGYYIVAERYRGAADVEANVRFTGGDVRLDWLGADERLFTKVDVLVEERSNGTPLQRNSTSLGNAAANYWRQRGRNSVSLLGYHTRGEFRAGFSAIAANRQSERLTSIQSVPSEAVGGAAFWRREQTRWNLLAGGDFQRVEGWSIDTLFPTGKRIGGGSLMQHGTFAQTDFSVGMGRIFLGARHQFTGQSRQFFSPSAGWTVGRRWWRVRGSAYRSYRAPTLNELYREFRAGNAVTLANAALRPETLFGAEVGLDLMGESRRVAVTVFRNDLRQVVANVTLSVTPQQITRQRQNAASALGRGVEVEVRERWRNWTAEAAYLMADSRFGSGLRVPQIPRHQGSAQLTWAGERTLVTFGFRTTAYQFDDDLNLFRLPGFGVSQLAARHRVWRNLSLTGAVENLWNREFYSGFTPVPATGAPRLVRAGLRWDGRLW